MLEEDERHKEMMESDLRRLAGIEEAKKKKKTRITCLGCGSGSGEKSGGQASKSSIPHRRYYQI